MTNKESLKDKDMIPESLVWHPIPDFEDERFIDEETKKRQKW